LRLTTRQAGTASRWPVSAATSRHAAAASSPRGRSIRAPASRTTAVMLSSALSNQWIVPLATPMIGAASGAAGAAK